MGRARRRGAAVVLLAAAAAPATGCTTHQCDASCVVLGGPPVLGCDNGGPAGATHTEGERLVWESSPANGPWLDFGPMRTFHIAYPQPFADTPTRIQCDITADAHHPQESGFGPCAGILFFRETPDGVDVFNPNCAGFGLRFVVSGAPASAPPDGGSDTSSE